MEEVNRLHGQHGAGLGRGGRAEGTGLEVMTHRGTGPQQGAMEPASSCAALIIHPACPFWEPKGQAQPRRHAWPGM